MRASPAILFSRYFVPAGLLASAIANGASFFLRRIGVIDSARYQADLSTFCRLPVRSWWLPASCHYRRVLSEQPLQVISFDPQRLYQLTAPELLLKFAKFGFIAGLISLSILLILKHRAPFPSLYQLLPALPFLGSLLLAFVIGFHHASAPLAILGLLSWPSLPMLLLGGWLSSAAQLSRLADAIGLLLFLQFPLGLVEAMRGLPTPFGPMIDTLRIPNPFLPSRLAFLFTLPNTLGVFVAVAFSFCLAFSSRRRLLPWLAVVILPQIFLARSATGFLVLLSVLAFIVLQRLLEISSRALLSSLIPPVVAVFGLVLALLPQLLARPDLWQSLDGRFWAFNHIVRTSSPSQLWFGHGLSSSGNHLSQIVAGRYPLQPLFDQWLSYPQLYPADSLLALLLSQGGLVAVMSFYALLLWAFQHAPQARPFFLAVLLSSFTMGITEVFPLGLLLALAVNHALLNPTLGRSPLPLCRPCAVHGRSAVGMIESSAAVGSDFRLH